MVKDFFINDADRGSDDRSRPYGLRSKFGLRLGQSLTRDVTATLMKDKSGDRACIVGDE